MTSKTIYVVSERSFEYNDEIYHLPHDGSGDKSGIPTLAFPDKETAIKVKKSKNLEWFKLVFVKDKYDNIDLTSYTYESLEELFSPELLAKLNIKVVTTGIYNDKSLEVPSDLSDEAYSLLMNDMSDVDLPWIVSEVIFSDS